MITRITLTLAFLCCSALWAANTVPPLNAIEFVFGTPSSVTTAPAIFELRLGGVNKEIQSFALEKIMARCFLARWVPVTKNLDRIYKHSAGRTINLFIVHVTGGSDLLGTKSTFEDEKAKDRLHRYPVFRAGCTLHPAPPAPQASAFTPSMVGTSAVQESG